MVWVYPASLAALSLLVALLERFFPWRKEQAQLRRYLASDLVYLVFNGHFLGVFVYRLSELHVLPHLRAAAGRAGLGGGPVDVAAAWPLWLQIPVALLVIDFLQWCVHNLLHRVPWLWEIHKVHHSVVDGEMDWIVSFRFHWGEVVVYKSLQYLPLLVFGFRVEAILVHAIFGTLIGHLNHSNLDLGRGAWRYVLNSPRMHIWHHDRDAASEGTKNFGIIFSLWDWIFGTAKMPDAPPARLGFEGVDRFPKSFLGQSGWPLNAPLANRNGPLAHGLGAAVVALGFLLVTERRADTGFSPLGPEPVASSQPSRAADDRYAPSLPAADEAIAAFGREAHAAGFAHPEDLVSVAELARALGSSRLALLDVRAPERFVAGHIPSARPMGRGDYEASAPIPGMSLPRDQLEAKLRARGVRKGAVVVLYGDGGPEPYRLWWTLREVGGLEARVLDGGLEAWKAGGFILAEGKGAEVAPGDVVLAGAGRAPALTWQEIEPRLAGAVHLDTRTEGEFLGTVKHPQAARAGHIPGAVHFDWTALLGDRRTLKAPEALKALFAGAGVTPDARVVTSCQTGTRSAVAYFALRQLGMPDDRLANYNGSWSEYSRTDLPLATGH